MGMNQSRLGNYELQERLGAGVVGEVWKAFDTQQRHYVTIKILPINAQSGADFTSRFYREGQILSALHHPNIAAVQNFRVSQSENEAYIITDYVEGPSLADFLNTTARVGKIPPPAEIVHLLTPIASALDYAHQHGALHGALRPSVVLLGTGGGTSPAPGELKLTDFGLNYLQNPLSLPLNDVSYISPEIAQGFTGTKQSDLYSLGVILYEMCTGAWPFYGDTPSDILMQHIHGTPTSPASINPQLPPALTAIIMRSLARDPAARFPTALALVTTVSNVLHVRPSEGSSYAQSSPGAITPSLSGISDSLDTMNSPTYLSHPSPLPASASSVPPVVTSSNTPATPPSPVIAPVTPLLPTTPTGSIPVLQTSAQAEMNMPTIPTPWPASAPAANTPFPTVPSDHLSLPQVIQPTAPPPVSPPPARKKRRGWLYVAAVALLLAVLGGSSLAYFYSMRGAPPASPPVVGHALFLSSGVVGGINSNQGITDELQINLQNLSAPPAGKQYYAWLLNDHQLDAPAVALGALSLNQRNVTMLYRDTLHSNLLADYGRFLITEEDANPPPISPSLDPNTWRYTAAFSTTPNPADTTNHFSLLDHLRHLLAQDPKLKLAGLGGGLDIWLFRNTSKILEAASSARDAQRLCTAAQPGICDFLRRAVVRVLDYLDGSAYAPRDVPPGTPLLIDQTVAHVALLEFDPVSQTPPGYLRHIGSHLREIASSPGVTAAQRALAIRISEDINNVQVWLNAVHADAVQLVHMNNTQLSQPGTLSILNDLFNQANTAFVGQFDPNTSTVREGVVQIHNDIQGLATFDVSPCTINSGKTACSI